ncbi:MAG: 23S rRNA (adenine(2503)-C(2))-methyltransferase RlmN [Ruminococcus sp.]|jgi:23S rRNA (adenine2503-C2)-methyltransferase|nr:23S rRNA (adenine(2503)-C(2))-methyltransferase RlmN [Ruminococcus sp.]
MNEKKLDILSLTLPELSEKLTALGEKKFRAQQIYGWLHVKRVQSFDEMSDISKNLRQKLSECFIIPKINAVKELISSQDGTRKYLFALPDGECIETVFMEYRHAHSLCVSSQVGCRMGCTFCASGKNGLVRNMTPSEMLLQVYEVERLTGKSIGSLVMMGIGEPLDNFDNTIKFLTLLSDENGKNLSLRHVSLSTCGLVSEIRKLADLRLGLTLSVSLHNADNAKRQEIMPIAKVYSVDDLIAACKDYIDRTGRRVSFEYAVIDGINDSSEDANKLSGALRGINCHINLIPVNSVDGTGYSKNNKSVLRFKEALERDRLQVTIRRTLGSDINAACGQLRMNHTQSNPC